MEDHIAGLGHVNVFVKLTSNIVSARREWEAVARLLDTDALGLGPPIQPAGAARPDAEFDEPDVTDPRLVRNARTISDVLMGRNLQDSCLDNLILPFETAHESIRSL